MLQSARIMGRAEMLARVTDRDTRDRHSQRGQNRGEGGEGPSLGGCDAPRPLGRIPLALPKLHNIPAWNSERRTHA